MPELHLRAGEHGRDGGVTSTGRSTGFVGGMIGNGVMTATNNGTTIQWRDDTATRVPITMNHAHVTGLQVIVRRQR